MANAIVGVLKDIFQQGLTFLGHDRDHLPNWKPAMISIVVVLLAVVTMVRWGSGCATVTRGAGAHGCHGFADAAVKRCPGFDGEVLRPGGGRGQTAPPEQRMPSSTRP
ncbi:MAG: hypothetical protein U0231_14420 [Nitrospiraceae bacterium]